MRPCPGIPDIRDIGRFGTVHSPFSTKPSGCPRLSQKVVCLKKCSTWSSWLYHSFPIKRAGSPSRIQSRTVTFAGGFTGSMKRRICSSPFKIRDRFIFWLSVEIFFCISGMPLGSVNNGPWSRKLHAGFGLHAGSLRTSRFGTFLDILAEGGKPGFRDRW